MLLWESDLSVHDVQDALVQQGVSLTAKDALFSTVIYGISTIFSDVYKYNSNDFQRLLNAVSKTPETKIVDVSIFLAVWRYVSLIKRNAESQRQQVDRAQGGGSREKAKLSVKDIANLFEVEQDLHHVITSNLLYSHIKKCIKDDGRYVSVRSFFSALGSVCGIHLAEAQLELLSHILAETGVWVRDEGAGGGDGGGDGGVIDLHVLMQVVYYAIFKSPLVVPSAGAGAGGSNSNPPHQRSGGNNNYVSSSTAATAYSNTTSERARNMERGQGGSSMLEAFSDAGSVYSEDQGLDEGLDRFASMEDEVGGRRGSIGTHPKVQNLLRAVSGYWDAIERCISVVMLKSFQNVLQGSGSGSAASNDPTAQMRSSQMCGLNIITRDLLTIAITNSALPATRADVHEIWKYIIQMKQRDGKLANLHLSLEDQKCSLEEVRHYVLESQKYSHADAGDQVERSTISRLMRDVDKPPIRGGGRPHPNSLDLNQWQLHERSAEHLGGRMRDTKDFQDLRLERSNIYMKIQQRLRGLLSKESEASQAQFDRFLQVLCDADLKAPVVLVTRGNFVAALKEVGVRVNKAEGDTVWSEAVTDLCDSHAAAGSKPTDNLSVPTFLEWLGLTVSPDRVHDALECALERQRHAFHTQQQRVSSGSVSGVRHVAYPVISSPERPVRRLAGGGSFKPELQRGSEIFPSHHADVEAEAEESSQSEPQGFSSGHERGFQESSVFIGAEEPSYQQQSQSQVSFADPQGSMSLANYSDVASVGASVQTPPGSPSRNAAGSKPTPRNNMSQLLQDNSEGDTASRVGTRAQNTRPGSGLSQGSSASGSVSGGGLSIDASSQGALNTRTQFAGHNIRNLLAPAADFECADRELSKIEDEPGAELSRYEILSELNQQKPMVAFLFRRLGGANNSNHNASTSSRASQFNIKAADFAEALTGPPLSLPISRENAWELVCEMLRCSVNSPKETTTITYRDIMEFLDNSPSDVVEEAYLEAKASVRSGKAGTQQVSPSKAQAISYREQQVRRILVRQLVDSRHVQGDRLRMLALLQPLRMRLRAMQSTGHASSAGSSGQRGQHGSRGEGFRSSGQSSQHTSWDTPDYCTVSELSRLLQSVDIVYTETELKYICQELESKSRSGDNYATEVGVKLGGVVLYLSNMLIGAGNE